MDMYVCMCVYSISNSNHAIAFTFKLITLRKA